MEINKLTNHLNNRVTGAKSDEVNETSDASKVERSSDGSSEKVTISNGSTNKSEELFAKIELEKLNQSSFEKLKGMKAKIQEFEAAKNISDEAAQKTEIGEMINDPELWGKIAQHIIDK